MPGAISSKSPLGRRPSPTWASTPVVCPTRAQPGRDPAWDFVNAGITKKFLAQEYQHALAGAVIMIVTSIVSCGILGQFKEERRAVGDQAWGCPPLGSGKPRQPVTARPVPLYFNEEMSPELAQQLGSGVAAGTTIAPQVAPLEAG